MKALVWSAAERMDWEERERPVPQDNEVLVRIEVVGICGSEIEGYLGHNSLRKPPLIMGHEFCGVVEQVGNQENGALIGKKIVVNPLLFCGNCGQCLKGLTQLCESRKIIGIHQPGAFAEWAIVPVEAVIEVPESMSSFRAALAEPLACSLRATRRAMERHPFSNVVVFGAGGIGLLCAMTASLLGASKVMIVDTNQARLTMSRSVGIEETANAREDKLEERAEQVFGSKGIDVVIDAAGFQPTREAAIKLLNPGGTFMNIGLGIDETVLPINHVIRNEIEILGSFCYTRQDFQDAVDLLIAGKITETGWTEIRPLSEGFQAFAQLVDGKVTSGKILLKP
ncbi:galactitol-1-phosphate 5-dehydrogenase [Paenibacillus baekrokdamisoli]|uniref:Galactitol-1-phosphate 5-dehydrogenase n=1 Tax=Paenibacillus baekrokdamisoli TaxID=1712516 RepID=A0A3G9J079_9BACL|nr:alcohol dehydrogenase catalytic domain-containing protein [Paenibacillus baekrokdamisoli]MBB3071367.1 threonine dehydrogenase-like Zn-dependent dehydrogenase [Paenibacillus baekrokdamisoli]BBH24597.1 galactitol-1-phosphate 5-dehydrogenase [Paenibacillus baekrokdamisoli]